MCELGECASMTKIRYRNHRLDIKNIHQILLSGKVVDEGDAYVLASALKGNTAIHTIDISRTNSLTKLFHIVDEVPYLQNLNINRSGLRHGVMNKLSKMLMNPLCCLRILNIANSINWYDETDYRQFISSLEMNTTLQVLDISQNHIGDGDMECFNRMIRTNRTLKSINLSDNNFTPIGVSSFFSALTHNSTLESMNISNNPFGNQPIEVLADVMKRNSSIHTINLSKCKIGIIGARYIADIIHSTTTVHTLDISGNPFGDSTCNIAHSLELNRSIRRINLGNTCLMMNSIREIMKMLRKNQVIRRINLYTYDDDHDIVINTTTRDIKIILSNPELF
jgi:hypothetical protein